MSELLIVLDGLIWVLLLQIACKWVKLFPLFQVGIPCLCCLFLSVGLSYMWLLKDVFVILF